MHSPAAYFVLAPALTRCPFIHFNMLKLQEAKLESCWIFFSMEFSCANLLLGAWITSRLLGSFLFCKSAFWSFGIQNHRCKESQDGWGWKGPLEVIWSNSNAQARPSKASCPGTYPDGSWISPKMKTPQAPWELVPVVSHPHSFLWGRFRGNLLCFSLCLFSLKNSRTHSLLEKNNTGNLNS